MVEDSYPEVVERFIRYAQVSTQSDPNSTSVPSTKRQLDLTNMLAGELTDLGLEVDPSDSGIVYAKLQGKLDLEPLGFVVHVDTATDAPGDGVKPIVHNYEGGDIVLPKYGTAIRASDNPLLANFVGEQIVTSSGDTLLGADDKAGIAELVTALDRLVQSGEDHGPVHVAITCDEEIGRGADHFDVDRFGAKQAYTIDGGQLGEYCFRNFNAATATVTIKGKAQHLGTAFGKRVDALKLARQYVGVLPPTESPDTTTGLMGYYEVLSITGNSERATVHVALRDFSYLDLHRRETALRKIGSAFNTMYGPGTAIVRCDEQYLNMGEKMGEKHPLVTNLVAAIEASGIDPIRKDIRGGTDGARLTHMGVLCPNIFTGAMNMHAREEWVAVRSLEKATEVAYNLMTSYRS